MPPWTRSRYSFTQGYQDADGDLVLTDPEPFGYRDDPDTVVHVCNEGDTLQGLAGTYYAGVQRAAGLWWVIADFQPQPIHDPTVALRGGQTILVPSLRLVDEVILAEERRDEVPW